MSRTRTFSLLGGLYVSQFLGVGFITVGLVAILREQGASLEQLSLIQVLGLFWALKFLWAPALDRWRLPWVQGHYRGWLLVLQPAVVVALLLLAGVEPTAGDTPLLVVAALVVLLSSTQDIAADALAVRALAPTDRGIGNGIQVAGGYLGSILGGGAVLVVYDNAGWPAAILTLALFTTLPIWQIVAYREPERPVRASDARPPGIRDVIGVFRDAGVRRWALLLMPLLWLGISAPYALLGPMLVDVGWSLTRIGLVTTVLAGSLAIPAAIASGTLVRSFGRRRALVTYSGMQVLAILLLLPLASGSTAGLLGTIAVCVFSMAYAAASTVINTINMDLARPATAGTDFTVLNSFALAVALAAGAVSLAVAGQIGYVPVLGASAAVVLLACLLALVTFVDRSPGGTDGTPAMVTSAATTPGLPEVDA